jgi:hypothetical protein
VKISIEKLLTKMEAELKQARSSQKEESLRERIYSIKILCELILDEKQTRDEAISPRTQAYQPVASQPFVQQPALIQQPTTVMPQPKKLEMDDDEANGDSLFDF